MFKKREVDASLERKGFVLRQGDHAYFIYFTIDGKKSTIKTKTSNSAGSTSIDKYLAGRMAKQLKISSKDFEDLVNCPLSRRDYEKKLRGSGEIE